MTGAAKTKSKDQRLSLERSRGWTLGLILSLLAMVGLLAANTMVVDSKTRPAQARDGGEIVETGIVPANVKVEGSGPPIVLVDGFGAALYWWDEIAPALRQQPGDPHRPDRPWRDRGAGLRLCDRTAGLARLGRAQDARCRPLQPYRPFHGWRGGDGGGGSQSGKGRAPGADRTHRPSPARRSTSGRSLPSRR